MLVTIYIVTLLGMMPKISGSADDVVQSDFQLIKQSSDYNRLSNTGANYYGVNFNVLFCGCSAVHKCDDLFTYLLTYLPISFSIVNTYKLRKQMFHRVKELGLGWV